MQEDAWVKLDNFLKELTKCSNDFKHSTRFKDSQWPTIETLHQNGHATIDTQIQQYRLPDILQILETHMMNDNHQFIMNVFSSKINIFS